MSDLGKKISALPETTDLNGLYTIGTDKNTTSKKVSLQFLKEAATYANAQGDYAKSIGDTVAGNVGSTDYPVFSASGIYAIGDVVRYNDRLYRFTAPHQAGSWTGADVELTSINEESQRKLTELEGEVIKLKLLVEDGVVIEGSGIPIVESEEQLVLLDAPIGSVASVVQLIQVAPMAEGETHPEPAPYIVDFYLHDADGWKPMAKQSHLDEVLENISTSINILKDEIINNEEVTAAALNDLNDNKVSHADMESAIAEAIATSVTTTLNTAI